MRSREFSRSQSGDPPDTESRNAESEKGKESMRKCEDDLSDEGEKKREERRTGDKTESGKELSRKEKGGSKTLDLICKLQEKQEEKKDRGRKDEKKVNENSNIRGVVSKHQGDKDTEEIKDKKTDVKKQDVSRTKTTEVPKNSKAGRVNLKDAEKEDKNSRFRKVEETSLDKTRAQKEREQVKPSENSMAKISTSSCHESSGNCHGADTCSITTEEDESYSEDLDSDTGSSMFDDLLEQVRSDDPELTEVNVNNSDAIKTDTLIQFAEGLRSNTHIKTFCLANTRADDHVAFAIAKTLRDNSTLTGINLDSNHLTGKGILAIINSLQHNSALMELRFHNQRHICGGKTEMEMAKVLRDNSSLLKLGYHFELAGPRMTMTNILSRNMDRKRQQRLEVQKLAGHEINSTTRDENKSSTDKTKSTTSPTPKKDSKIASLSKFTSAQEKFKASPTKPLSKLLPTEVTGSKKGATGSGQTPPPPPPPPPGPALDVQALRRSLTPVSQRKPDGSTAVRQTDRSSRDQLLDSIRNCSMDALKKASDVDLTCYRCCCTSPS